MRDGVEAKLCAGPDGEETFVLVRSAERRAKERAMHDRFCERIETALVRPDRLGIQLPERLRIRFA